MNNTERDLLNPKEGEENEGSKKKPAPLFEEDDPALSDSDKGDKDAENELGDDEDSSQMSIKVAVPKYSYPSNAINNSKYTFWNFLPKNLFEQFSSPIYLFYLVVVFLELIPGISASQNIPFSLFPLLFFLIIQVIIDITIDHGVRKDDQADNNLKTEIWNRDQEVATDWQNIYPGHVVVVREDGKVPADLLLIYSSNMNSKCCYIQTNEIDGDKNLKVRMMIPTGDDMEDTEAREFVNYFTNIKVTYEKPNPGLNSFKGSLKLGNKTIPLLPSHLVLRGSILKDTRFIIGIALYTGHDTKLHQNVVKKREKVSPLWVKMNSAIWINFYITIGLVIFCTIYFMIFVSIEKNNKPYFDTENTNFFFLFLKGLTFWIQNCALILPIGIKTKLHLCFQGQAVRMENQDKLRTPILDSGGLETRNTINCIVRNSYLNDCLGQINQIFFDKCGTLTKNEKTVSKLLVGRYEFCEKKNEEDKEVDDTRDQKFIELLKDVGKEGQKCQNLLRCMAMCHNVFFNNSMNFISMNTEELASVLFAKEYGYNFSVPVETENVLTYNLKEGENEEEPEVEYIFHMKFDYTKERGRLSILLSSKKDPGTFHLFTKGKLTSVFPFLSNMESPDMEPIEEAVNKASKKGFSTLVFAHKKLNRKDYEKFIQDYEIAKGKGLEYMQEKQEELEHGLGLLGAAAYDDVIPEKIGDTIKFLRGAKMKMWVLSDENLTESVRTMRQIGLVGNSYEFVKYSEPKKIRESFYVDLDQKLQGLDSKKKIASLVSAEYFSTIHEYKRTNEVLYKQFVDLLMRSETVLLHGANVVQKRQIIEMVRTHDPKIVTMAVGAGVSNTQMLVAAHIGVGIVDKEGMQASLAGDYSLGDVRQIIYLIFVYGRESYRKNSSVILFSFYKNMMIAFPQIWYGFFNFFSPQRLYAPIITQIFDPLIAFLPIIIYGIFDKTYSKAQLIFSPELYQSGIDHYYFKLWRYGYFIIYCAISSLYFTLIALSALDWGNYENGQHFGFVNFGNGLFQGIVILVSLRIFVISNSFSLQTILILLISVAISFGAWFLLSRYEASVLYQTFDELIYAKQFYFLIFIAFTIFIFEVLISRYEFERNERKYIPDFDLKFDAADENQIKVKKLDISAVDELARDRIHGDDADSELDNSEYFDEEDDNGRSEA